LRQFPEVPTDYDVALRGLDADYAKTLDLIYGAADVPANGDLAQAKLIRNRMIERRMAVIDEYFKDFQGELVREHVRADFGIALVGIGVGAAGSLVAETASQILSAVSGGLAGAQAAYGKAVFYERAMSALLAQMQAGRKTIAAQILQRWHADLDQYPMWMVRTDLEAYYFAGSLPGAILGAAADAKVKETQAELILRPLTGQLATPEMLSRRTALTRAIEALNGSKAKNLVDQIAADATGFQSFADAKSILNDHYPTAARVQDADGKKAIEVLKRAVLHAVHSPEDAERWQALIGRL
jgi:hypothetical protein